MPGTIVSVRSRVHAITHVTNNITKSFKDIIRSSGLDPAKLMSSWAVLELGFKTWIESGHLEVITLEIFDPRIGVPLGFWDVGISYAYSDSDGEFWTDTDAIEYAIRKAGVHPSTADYRIIATTKDGRPDVAGWSTTTARCRDGFVEQRIGTTVEASGLSGNFSYYRRA